MQQYLFMSRSMTTAQRAARLLERNGINANVVKAPQKLSTNGCGYAVVIAGRYYEAYKLLSDNNLITGKIFKRSNSEDYREVTG